MQQLAQQGRSRADTGPPTPAVRRTSRDGSLPQDGAHSMRRAIRAQREAHATGLEPTTIDLDLGDSPRHPTGVLHRDLIPRPVIPERDFEAPPRARNAGA